MNRINPTNERNSETENARLKVGPAPELVESAFQLEVADAAVLWKGMGLADLAHVVHLQEISVIPQPMASGLLTLLLELHAMPSRMFRLDASLEDVYSNRERWLSDRDEQAAGWIGAGRARRESATTAYRIAGRDLLLELARELVGLVCAVCDRAEEHVATIMPDYTYLQYAQPTTLAHYLMSFAFPFLRDLERLQGCFDRSNQCPAGIGSINGSRLPINRSRLAELLGFSKAIPHSRDAMWQVDEPVEVMSIMTAMCMHMDRLAEDLQIWNTSEFNFAELADKHARISRIMPQKKNPYALAFIRGVAGTMIGRLVSVSAVAKTPSAQVDNRIFVIGQVPDALGQLIQTVKLFSAVIRGIQFHTDVMNQRAAEGFGQATDLAELLMESEGINYRTAHRIVALAVRIAIDAGSDRLVDQDLNQASEQVLGHHLENPSDCLRSVSGPDAVVQTRQGLGGAAPNSVRAMIGESRSAMIAVADWRNRVANGLADCEKRLVDQATKLSLLKIGS